MLKEIISEQETYIKDEGVLESFLIRLGVEAIKLKVGSKTVSGQELEKLTKLLIRYEHFLERARKRGDPRLLEAIVVSTDLTEATLKSEKNIDVELDKVAAYLNSHTTGLKDFQLEVQPDPEHGAHKIVYQTVYLNAPTQTVIDIPFLNSPEFTELMRIQKELQPYGRSPFHWISGSEEFSGDRLTELKDFILSAGREGQDIQRYKGLGEMNPSQLWETTLNPETRTLLQVRIEDAVEAEDIFSVLMGDQVDPRRQFIEENALHVKNLDI